MRRLAPRLLACALFLGSAAQAHPFTIHDLLAQQRLGEVTASPDGRWLTVATTDPVTQVRRWDLDGDSDMTVGQIVLFDLARPGPPRRLADPGGRGLTPGPYSPSGRRIAVLGAKDGAVEVGIVDLATGALRWTGVRPITGDMGRSMQWRSDDELVVAVLDSGAPTPTRGFQASIRTRMNGQWDKTTGGAVGLTYFGSGRYLSRIAQPVYGRLVTVSATGAATRDLLPGDIIDLEVSPDGARAAVLVGAETIGAPVSGPVSLADRMARRTRLLVVDLTDGATWEPRPDEDIATGLISWSPSGRQLLFYARSKDGLWTQGRYWRAAVQGQTVTPLTTAGVEGVVETSPYGSLLPRGAWMGETPATLARPVGTSAVPSWRLWAAKGPFALEEGLPAGPHNLEATSPTSAVFSAAGRLYRVALDGRATDLGEGAAIAAGGGSERLRFNARPSLTEARFLAGRPDAAIPLRLDPSGRRVALAPPVPAGEDVLALAAGRAITHARNAHGVETVRWRAANAAPRDLVVINAQLSDVDFVTPRPIHHVDRNGKALTSWLFLPPGLPADQRAPLVLLPYPGRNYPQPPREHAPPSPYAYANPQLLAGAGFAVLIPSLPVEPDREPTEGLADRVLAVAEAAQTQGQPVDLTRMGVFGHSYGGYGALVLATQSPRFKAIVASAANSDLASHYTRRSLWGGLFPDVGSGFNLNAAWAETGQGRMGVAPWQDPGRYVRNSPLYHAGQITAPVMLVQGGLDANPGQALGMFGALLRQNKDAQLLSYNAEGHALATPANQADEWTRVIAFFRETLR